MVGIKFQGRLGNQLFQYIFYKYISETNPKKRVFFVNPHHAYLGRYFVLDHDNWWLESKLYSIYSRILWRILPWKNKFVHNLFAPKNVVASDGELYDGYYQSDWYWLQLKAKPLIRLKEQYVQEFEAQYGHLFRTSKTIVVHIRRTDYLSYGKRDISLPIAYFRRELLKIPDLANYRVLFVSDDIGYVKSYFGEQTNYSYLQNNEIIDFQVIQHANIAIISNSTFAWWACYLSPVKQHVIAPTNWMGFRLGREHPKGVMTHRFNWTHVLG